MKKRILLLTKSTFLSISVIAILFAVLAPDGTFDQLNGIHKNAIGSTNDIQKPTLSILEESKKEILFIENLGQIRSTEGEERPDVLFHTRSDGVDMYIRESGVTYVFRNDEIDLDNPLISALSRSETLNSKSNLYRLDMTFDGMNRDLIIRKEKTVDQQFNYYTPEHPDGIFPK